MQKQPVVSASVLEGMLLDSSGLSNGPTEDKLVIVFHTLDTIIPLLGVYRDLIKVCRTELFDAVYSKELTGAVDTNDQSCVRRIPYFILAQQLLTQQDEKRDELVQQLEDVNKRMLGIQVKCDSALELISQLETTRHEQMNIIDGLNANLQTEIMKTESLQNELNVLKRKTDEKCHLMNCDISRLQRELCDMTDTVVKLKPYKTSYDALRTALHQPTGSGSINTHRLNAGTSAVHKEQKTGQLATYPAALISDVDSCHQLEQQILAAQNAIIEEYDLFIEEAKKVDFEFPIQGFRSNSRDHEANLLDNRLQVAVVKANFKSSLGEIDKELALLRQHKVLLEAHLVELENGRISSRRQKPEENLTAGDGTMTSDNDGDEDDCLLLDPFTPHERLLNKYAVMLYSSVNNAKSFFEFPEAEYCPSCAEKTVICPHKLLKQEHVFKLPNSVTHLKVSRPRARIATHRSTLSATRRLLKSTDDSKQVCVQDEGDMCHAPASFDLVWKDYETRTDQKRLLSRPLTLDRTKSLLLQFVSYLLSQDIIEPVSNEVHSILDCLYEFMQLRYIELDVLFLATHDFLSSLLSHAANNKLMKLMTHVLANNLDACALRYVLLMKDLMQPINWTKNEDFCQFAIILYPFLNQDDLEVLQLEYTSFSENKISETLVIDYIITMVLQNKEPRFLEMETFLLDHPGKDSELMTELEFVAAAEDAISLSCENLQRHFYRQTAANLNASHHIPVSRLAQITSYLNLLGCAVQVKREIKRNFNS
jgi:hypothetical protein